MKRRWFSLLARGGWLVLISIGCLHFTRLAAAGNLLLDPVDTSSPRDTFKSFLALTNEFSRRYAEYRESPNASTQDRLFRLPLEAKPLLDLSGIPPASQREVAGATLYLLLDIMRHLELPDERDIPDVAQVEASDREGKPLTRWRVPGAGITIERVADGPRAGEFLFSRETIENVRFLHQLALELPYRRPPPSGETHEFLLAQTGWMIPMTWVEALPSWARTLVFDMMLWKWLMLALMFGVAFAAVAVLFHWSRLREWDGSLRAYLRFATVPVAIMVLVPLLWNFATYQINLTGSAAASPLYPLELAFGIAAVWIIWLTVSAIAEGLVASPRIGSKSLDAHLIRLAFRCIGIVAAFVVIFRVAQDLGVPLYGLVAGAGVSGLAVALAAKTTLENFIWAVSRIKCNTGLMKHSV